MQPSGKEESPLEKIILLPRNNLKVNGSQWTLESGKWQAIVVSIYSHFLDIENLKSQSKEYMYIRGDN